MPCPHVLCRVEFLLETEHIWITIVLQMLQTKYKLIMKADYQQ